MSALPVLDCNHESTDPWLVCLCVLKGEPVTLISHKWGIVACTRHEGLDSVISFMTICAGCVQERGFLLNPVGAGGQGSPA